MLMKQSKMQFQEIQISPLDNGGPEQLREFYEKDNQREDSFIEKMNVETHLLDFDKTIYGIGEE